MSGSDLTQGAWDELQADRDRWRARADALATALRKVEGLCARVHQHHGVGWSNAMTDAMGTARAALRAYDEEAGR